MDKYIDREAFLAAKRKVYCADCNSRKNSKGKMVYDIGDVPCRACRVGDMLDDVADFPAADVIERKHGKWKRRIVDNGFNADWKCSECGYKVMSDFFDFNFCPNCGADMRGEDDGYEKAVEQMEYDMLYEPTYNPKDGSM